MLEVRTVRGGHSGRLARVLAATAALAMTAGVAFADDDLPANAHLMPFEFKVTFNPDTQQAAYHEFIWQTFVALNWPAKDGGVRGEPDTAKSILDQKGFGTLDPAVWETYREPFEIFPPPDQWDNYPDWNDPRVYTVDVPKGAKALSRYAKIPAGFIEDFATAVNQPDFFIFGPTGPLVDQNGNYVRYEVAANQSYFTYIAQNKYYQGPEQTRASKAYAKDPSDPTGFKAPPSGLEDYVQALPPYARQGLVEIKASWRELIEGKDDFTRYFHRPVVPVDVDGKAGKPVTMGLVAFHILRYTPNDRIAATFEQVDNVEVGHNAPDGLKPSFNTGAAPNSAQERLGFDGEIPEAITKDNPPKSNPTPIDIYRVTPIPRDVQDINRKYQELLGESVFAYYQLINTQNRYLASASDPVRGPTGPTTGVDTNTPNLVNTALESYTQRNYSCILCHVQARPLGVGAGAREIDHFKILSFLLRNAQFPPKPTADAAGD